MSPFQQQYPLSPRKFWKKMLSSLVSRRLYPQGGGGLIGATFVLIIFVVLAVPILLRFGPVLTAPGSEMLVQGMSTAALVGGVVFAAIFLYAVYFLCKAWYVSAYIRRYFYDVNGDVITIRKGVFTPQEIHVLWTKVQDVYVDQDFFDRMLGIYDVHLASATATSGIEAHIDGVSKETADGLKAYLLSRISEVHEPSAAPVPTLKQE